VRLGSHGIRFSVVLERLTGDETSGEVVCRARPGHQSGRGDSVVRWDVLAFLARVLDHVSDPGELPLRCRGFCSNAARTRHERRADKARAVSSVGRDPGDTEGRQRRLTWLYPPPYARSRLIRKVF
jgi:hypothetical protein